MPLFTDTSLWIVNMQRLWIFGIFGLLLVAVLLTLLFVFLFGNNNVSEEILVKTSSGTLRGFRSEDGEYVQFLGVPYALVNKSNPFGESQPHPKLDGIFEANDDSAICPQLYQPQSTLDCLQMNIFVPKAINASNRFPVMFWIHGGGFAFGAKSKFSFGPKYLIRHDVILVSINYRIDVYGFMCLDIPEVPGNQGLKDQALAFRWIRENIKAFGGDANRVTPFGLSAGAHSVDFHILSENEILFDRAIIQSGSSLSATVYNNHDKNAPIKIAKQLGYNTNSLVEAITFLATVNTESVIQASNELRIIYKPCVEKRFDNVDPFLTKHWVNTALTPKVKNMAVMAGFCEDELLLFHVNQVNFENSTAIVERLNSLFNFEDDRLHKMEQKIRSFFFDGKESIYEKIMATTNFDSDMTYIYPILRSIRKFIKSEAHNIFYYMFSYTGKRNFEKIIANVSIGSAVHGDEVGYLFDVQYFSGSINPADRLIMDRMTMMWTNFAKYRDPTPEKSDLLPVKWEPIKDNPYNYFKIDTELKLNAGPNPERMAFWDEFYEINGGYEKEFIKED